MSIVIFLARVIRPLLFFCFSLNNIWIHGFEPKKKNALVLSVWAGYIEIPEKATEKKNTLSSEGNWHLEVGHRSHMLAWHNGTGCCKSPQCFVNQDYGSNMHIVPGRIGLCLVVDVNYRVILGLR